MDPLDGQAGLGEGARPVDLPVVLDPEARWTVRPDVFYSRSRNTPFAGRELRGQADLTIVRGQVVFQRGD